ncbi:hypothetical protein AS888_18755 [Peribacillus simplex]|uniref:Oligosaccharide repeat unit polymerase n=1 Tax=Peribacillus simplex TaxID=1478 RepID=A0A109MYV5_9BACI|nr:hypothetical protein [Peribacillus simplex]KWW20406.1 hypothetical protein AS888_18755 [Peribacillus simplex]
MKLIQIILVGLYVLLLDISYVHFISPEYGYMGFVFRGPPTAGMIAYSMFFILLPVLFTKNDLQKPSELVFWILYFIVYIPVAWVPNYLFSDIQPKFIYTNTMLFLCLLIIGNVNRLPALKFTPAHMKMGLLKVVFIVSLLIFFLYTFMVSGGISLKPPIDAEDIYDKRMISRVKLTPAGGYIIQWLAKVWNPLIVAFGLCRKKFSYVFLGLALQYLLYTTNGLKSTLLSTFLLIMVFIASHDKGRNFAIYFCLSLCSLLGISILLDFILDQAYLSNLFARRMIITPGLLTTYYIDFFSTHPKALLSYNILERFIDPVYDRSPPYIIGTEYFGRPQMAANANMFADAFANFGYIGLFMYTGILSVLLWIYDSLTEDVKWRRFGIILFVIPAWCLADTSLTTTFVTGGMVFTFLIMYALPGADTQKGVNK